MPGKTETSDLRIVLGAKGDCVLAMCIVKDDRLVRVAIDEDYEQGERLRLIDVMPPNLEAANGYFEEMLEDCSLMEVDAEDVESVGLIFREGESGQEGV